jgi:GTP cyclohydrolase II
VNENAVEQVASAEFPTRWGKFRIYGFRGHSVPDADRRVEEAVALVMGDVNSQAPLVRVHSQCLTGDVFHSLRCDCRQQLELSLSMIAEEGAGILIYEQQEGRGIGLIAKLQAYALQDQGLDTVAANQALGFEADCRDFSLSAVILNHLGIRNIRLLSNNPEKRHALARAGISVVQQIPCETSPHPWALKYLKTKKERMGHTLSNV